MFQKYRLSKRAMLFLRLITSTPHHIWYPGSRWSDAVIEDGSGDVVPNVGGGADARILQSLMDKGLIMKMNRSSGWCGLSATPEGEVLVQKAKWRERE